MPTKKKGKLEFEAVIMAVGVGVAAQPLMDVLEKHAFKKTPQMVPAVVMAAGVALNYFAGDKFKPASYALMAVSAGDLAGDLFAKLGKGDEAKSYDLSGMSRVQPSALNQMPVTQSDYDLSGIDLDDFMDDDDEEIIEEYGDGTE